MTEIFRNSKVNNSALKAYIKSVESTAASKERSKVEEGKLQRDTIDEISFSSKAKEISSLIKKAKSLPEVREEVVTSLKAKIESGEYHVDASEIAKAILSKERIL